jgi:TolB-like protein
MSPTADDVRRQLERLLASAVFANAGRMSRFLRFVVERTLAGDGTRLKEYVIGVEVFDRDADYDPRVDSIVRVEAARLRAKLAEYYAGEGRDDAVVLTLPKGGYTPTLKLAATQQDTAAAAHAANGTAALATALARRPFQAWRTWAAGAALAAAATVAVVAWTPGIAPELRLAVMPFEPDDERAGKAAHLLTEGVTAELVRDGRFEVVASSAARAEYGVGRRPRDVAAALRADVVIEARVAANGPRLRVEARAADGHTEQKLWVQGFAGDGTDLETLEREIGAAIAAAFSATTVARPD